MPSANLCLSMPAELERLLGLLSEAYFCQQGRDGATPDSLGGGTGNVLSQLVHKGLEAYEPILDAAIAHQERDLLSYSEIAAHLNEEPDRAGVRASDFNEGSAAHHVLSGIEAMNSADDALWDEETTAAWTLTRTEALRELHWRRTRLEVLKAARSGIADAIRSKPWLHVSHAGGNAS